MEAGRSEQANEQNKMTSFHFNLGLLLVLIAASDIVMRSDTHDLSLFTPRRPYHLPSALPRCSEAKKHHDRKSKVTVTPAAKSPKKGPIVGATSSSYSSLTTCPTSGGISTVMQSSTVNGIAGYQVRSHVAPAVHSISPREQPMHGIT